jgi:hypothetical protein
MNMGSKKVSESEISAYLDLLENTPRRILACTAELESEALHRAPQPGAWSVIQILAHLRAGADVWAYSIYAMLTLDNPVLPDIHPRKWAKTVQYEKLDFNDSLRAFELGRLALVLVLKALPAESWSRTAVIGKRGHSVFSQVRRIAKHEIDHCEQIERLVEEMQAASLQPQGG